MNQKLFDVSAKEIALFMFNVGITKEPTLSFFEDDGGIFERLFAEHMESPEVSALKDISEDLYLRVLGMHAFGAGAYAAAKEINFREEEIEEIFSDFDSADAYELAIKKLGFSMESGNRKMLDRVIVIGIKEAKLFAKDEATNPENLETFMKVLFNAGISVYRLR